MGKKAKAQTATQPQSVVSVPGDDLAAMMMGAGVAAEPVKSSKSSVSELKIDDAGKLAQINRYVEYDAREKAAKAMKENIGEQIRPWMKSAYVAFCRVAKMFHKTISINGDMNFGSVQLKVAKADPDKGKTPALIKQGLKDHFGDKYAEYVEDTITIFVKPEVTNKDTIAMLQKALGAEFGRIFTFEQDIGLREIGGDKDKIVVLKRDAILDPLLDASVKAAVDKGLLTENMGSITSQKSALALAEEKLVKEEADRQQRLNANGNVAAAAAAGAAAGVAAAQMS